MDKMYFDIAGGKYEPDGSINYKYCNATMSFAEALQLYQSYAQDYPYSYLRLQIVDVHGRVIHTKTFAGDPTDEENQEYMLRMGVSHAWMLAMGKQFVAVDMDPQDQLEDIKHALKSRTLLKERLLLRESQLKRCAEELAEARATLSRIKELSHV